MGDNDHTTPVHVATPLPVISKPPLRTLSKVFGQHKIQEYLEDANLHIKEQEEEQSESSSDDQRARPHKHLSGMLNVQQKYADTFNAFSNRDSKESILTSGDKSSEDSKSSKSDDGQDESIKDEIKEVTEPDETVQKVQEEGAEEAVQEAKENED